MNWHWKHYKELTRDDLHDIVKVRQEVFVRDRERAYVDTDGQDPEAWHLWGEENGRLVAYLRVFAPGFRYPEASVGRVLVIPEMRGKGLGKEIMREALKRIASQFGPTPVKLAAQAHLVAFYNDLGFESDGPPHVEVNIPHQNMRKA